MKCTLSKGQLSPVSHPLAPFHPNRAAHLAHSPGGLFPSSLPTYLLVWVQISTRVLGCLRISMVAMAKVNVFPVPKGP